MNGPGFSWVYIFFSTRNLIQACQANLTPTQDYRVQSTFPPQLMKWFGFWLALQGLEGEPNSNTSLPIASPSHLVEGKIHHAPLSTIYYVLFDFSFVEAQLADTQFKPRARPWWLVSCMMMTWLIWLITSFYGLRHVPKWSGPTFSTRIKELQSLTGKFDL